MTIIYRFIDWYFDENDGYGTYEECLEMFNKAIQEEPKGRFSIYKIEETLEGNFTEEGILFNENCSEYKL